MNKLQFKICKSSSIYQCIRPIFYLSKIFGLAPFNLPSKNGIVKTTFYDYLLWLLSETVYLYFLYFIIFSNYILSPSMSVVLSICGFAAVLWILFITIVSIVLSMIFRRQSYNVLRLVNECDEEVKISLTSCNEPLIDFTFS